VWLCSSLFQIMSFLNYHFIIVLLSAFEFRLCNIHPCSSVWFICFLLFIVVHYNYCFQQFALCSSSSQM
jgi:hypothetical protein